MQRYWSYNTARGKVTIACDALGLTRLAFGEVLLEGERRPSSLANDAATQLQEYLAGRRRLFDLPLHAGGTGFQLEVWRALEMIPYGETRTYAQLAEYIGRPNAARAVGGANRANPLPIFVPCHRVVPASGGVGGYVYGEQMKRYLLELEKRNR